MKNVIIFKFLFSCVKKIVCNNITVHFFTRDSITSPINHHFNKVVVTIELLTKLL